MSSYIRQNNKGSTMVMANDDEDSEKLVIDESRTGSPMNGQNDVNTPATNTDQPNGIENPINYITLMQKNENIRKIFNNFPSSQNISNQQKVIDANQAHNPRIACKDFSRKPISTNFSALLKTTDTTNVVGTSSAQITDVSNEDTSKGSGSRRSEDTSTYSGNRHYGDTPRDEGNSQNFNNLHFDVLREPPIRPPTSVYVPKPPSSASLRADNPFDDSASVNTSLIQKDPRPNTYVEHHIDYSTIRRQSTVTTHQPPDYETAVATAGRQAATYPLATALKTAHKNGYPGMVGHQRDLRIAANPQIEHLNQRDPRTATNINFQGVTRENNIGHIRAAARIDQSRKSVPAPPIRQAATNLPTALSKNVRQTQIGYEPQRDQTITTNINILDVPTGNTLPPTQGTVKMVAHLRSTLEMPTYLEPMAPTQKQTTHAATTSGMNGYPVPIGLQTPIDSRIAINTAGSGILPLIQGMLSVNHHQASVKSHPGTLSGTTGYIYGQAANTLPIAMSVNGYHLQTRTDLAAHEREVYSHQSSVGSVIMSTPEGQPYFNCNPECPSRNGTIAHNSFNLEPPANTLPVTPYYLSSVMSCNVPRDPSLYRNIHPGVPISNVQPNRWSEPNPTHIINPNLLQNFIYRGSEVDSSTYLATNISPTHVNTPGCSDTLNMIPAITANIQKAFDTINCKRTPNGTVITKPDSEKKTRKRATKTRTKTVESIKSKKLEFNPQETQNEVKIKQSSLNQVILNNNGTNINNTEVSIHANMNIAQTCVTDSSNSLILSPNTTQREQTDACTHSNKMDVETKLALLHSDIENLKTVIDCMTKEIQSNPIKPHNCDMIDIETALDFIESDTTRAQTGVTETTITILPSTDIIKNVQINDVTQQVSNKTNIDADLNFTQTSYTAVLLPNTTQKFEIDYVSQKANNKIDNKDENLLDSKTDEILIDATQASNTLFQSPNTTQTIQIDTVKQESNNKLYNLPTKVLLDLNAHRTQTKVPGTSDGVIKSLDTVQNVHANSLTHNPINYMDIEAKLEMLFSNMGRDQKNVMSEPPDQSMNVTQNVEADTFKQQIINDTDVKTAETLLHPNAGSEQTNVTLNCNAHILSTNVLEINATPTSTPTKTTSHKPTNNGYKTKTCTSKDDVHSSDDKKSYKLKKIDFGTERKRTVSLVASDTRQNYHINFSTGNTGQKDVHNCENIPYQQASVENIYCKIENDGKPQQNTMNISDLTKPKLDQVSDKSIYLKEEYRSDSLTKNSNTSDFPSHKRPSSTKQSTDTNKEDCDSKEQLFSITNSVPCHSEPAAIGNRGNHDANNKSDNPFLIKLPLNMLNELCRKALLNRTKSDVNDRSQTNSDENKYKTLNSKATKKNTNDEFSNNQTSDHYNKETSPPLKNGEIKNSEGPTKKSKLNNLDSSSKIQSKKQNRNKKSRSHRLDENYKNKSSNTTNLGLKNKDNNINKMRLVSELLDNKINRTSNKSSKNRNNEDPRNTNLVVNDKNDNIQNQMESLRSLNTNLATNDNQNNVENQTDNQRSLYKSIAEIDKHDKSQKQIDSSEKEKSQHTNIAPNSCKRDVIVINMINGRTSIKHISAPTLDTSSTVKSSVVKKTHYDNKRKALYESDESTTEKELANSIKKIKGICKSTDKPKTIQDSASFKENDVSNSNRNNELPKMKITEKKSTGKPFYNYTCPHCLAPYEKFKCFRKHLTKNHDDKDRDIFKYRISMKKCGICSDSVVAGDLRTHIKTFHVARSNLKVQTNKQN